VVFAANNCAEYRPCQNFHGIHYHDLQKRSKVEMHIYHALPWIFITISVYLLGSQLHKKCPYTWCSPIFIWPAFVVILLFLTNINYLSYQWATQPITFFLGPVQLAMVIPLYKHASILKKNLLSILSGVLIGTCSGI
jgi:putative effector of murein hydrolase